MRFFGGGLSFRPHSVRGFTLVELLVALTIIVILSTITVAAISFSIEGDRIAGGARQVQSMLEGGRDRAIYSGQPRGVRLVLDPAFTDATGSATAVSSLVFIGAPDRFSQSAVRFHRDSANASGDYLYVELIRPTPSPPPMVGDTFPPLTASPAEHPWERWRTRGLLPTNYAKVRLMRYPGDVGEWITMDFNAAPPATAGGGMGGHKYTLTKPFKTDPTGANTIPDDSNGLGVWPEAGLPYELELNPSILPNQEPRLLPRGVVIDLRSAYVWDKIPVGWYTVTGDGGDGSAIGAARANDTLVFVQEMDILFSPRGSGEGEILSMGVVHLPLADVGDLARGFRIDVDALDSTGTAPIVATTTDALLRDAVDEGIISVFPRTGSIVVTEPDVLDANADGLRDDAWRYAETGGEG